MDILLVQKGASLAMLEQQSNRKTSLRGGVVVIVVFNGKRKWLEI